MTPSLFEYQLDLLKLELQTINSSIRQMDEITKSIKHWTVGLWTAALGFCLASNELRPYTVATAAIPLVFWFIEASYRQIQRRFIWRSERIGDFITHDLKQSFKVSEMINFRIWDPTSVYSKTCGYKKFISIRKVLKFPSTLYLYLGLALLSIVFALVAYFRDCFAVAV